MQNQKGNKSIIVSFIIVICAVVLIIFGLSKGDKKIVETSKDTNIVEESLDTNNQMEENNNQSTEKVAKAGDTLTVNYTGRLTNGTVFDSNVLPEFNHVAPFQFNLGAGQVIAGWEEGFVGMKEGEKKTLTISPEKAYGSRGVGSIPPNSTLIFEVELVKIN